MSTCSLCEGVEHITCTHSLGRMLYIVSSNCSSKKKECLNVIRPLMAPTCRAREVSSPPER